MCLARDGRQRKMAVLHTTTQPSSLCCCPSRERWPLAPLTAPSVRPSMRAVTRSARRGTRTPQALIAHQIKHHPADPTMNLRLAAVLFRFPLSSRRNVQLPRISHPGQAVDVISAFYLLSRLLLDRRHFRRLPSSTAPSAGAVDAAFALRRLPRLLPGFCFGFRFRSALSSPP